VLPGNRRRARVVLRRCGSGRRARRVERRMMDTIAAARAVGGTAVGPAAMFMRVTTDSRAIVPGDLFVALAGERFDGHDYVDAALSAGAAAAMVAQARAPQLAGPLIAVPDPQTALCALARH